MPPSSVTYSRPTSPASLCIVDELGTVLWAYDRKNRRLYAEKDHVIIGLATSS
jgi:hypothetical protein